MTSKTHLVFVYGSLKQGFHNNDVLGSARMVMVTSTLEKYVMRSLGSFPGVIEDSTAKQAAPIKGEVYYVNDATLASLDQLEGNGTFYQRKLVNVYGMNDPVWMYFFLGDDEPSWMGSDPDNRVRLTSEGSLVWGHPLRVMAF